MRLCVIIAYLATFASFAQSDIEVVQYSAEFVKPNEISLKSFRYDTKTLYMSKAQDQFKKLNIKYIPTVILFYNGEEVYRVESGISLKLPENSIELIGNEIEEIIESKF
jgi:thiol-disulfide isomerase/thioredoxin